MTRYRIHIKASKIPKSAGTKGFGTAQQYRVYENKTYRTRSIAENALKQYNKKNRSFNTALGAKYKIRSVATKKRQLGFFR